MVRPIWARVLLIVLAVRVIGAPAGLCLQVNGDGADNILMFRVCTWPQPRCRLGSSELLLLGTAAEVIDTSRLAHPTPPRSFGLHAEDPPLPLLAQGRSPARFAAILRC